VSSGKVLIPGFMMNPDTRRAFADAGFELDFALSEEERSHGRWAFERAAMRSEITQKALAERLHEARVLCANDVTGHLPVTADMIRRADQLEVIYIGAAGFDKIDAAAATERGIVIFNAPGGNAIGVSEHALALMLTLTRRVDAASRYSRETGKWARQYAMTSTPAIGELHGKTLGIVGFGFIGRHLADRARLGFQMRIVAYDPFFDRLEAERLGVELVHDLHELLAQSDFVSLHTPLNAATEGLIGREEFKVMKPSANLINTARGPIVDTDALIEALENRQIAGAGLDCTEPEPLPDNHKLFTMQNVVLTPHVGGACAEDIKRSELVAARLAIEFLQGRGARHAANPRAVERHKARFG
jgi:phosphoglycerate dehydrogenase-like enzyme